MGGHPVFHPTPLTQCLGLGSSGKASELGPPGASLWLPFCLEITCDENKFCLIFACASSFSPHSCFHEALAMCSSQQDYPPAPSRFCSRRNGSWSQVGGTGELKPTHWEMQSSPRLGSDSTAAVGVQPPAQSSRQFDGLAGRLVGKKHAR